PTGSPVDSAVRWQCLGVPVAELLLTGVASDRMLLLRSLAPRPLEYEVAFSSVGDRAPSKSLRLTVASLSTVRVHVDDIRTPDAQGEIVVTQAQSGFRKAIAISR